jgi:hypothetical protein
MKWSKKAEKIRKVYQVVFASENHRLQVVEQFIEIWVMMQKLGNVYIHGQMEVVKKLSTKSTSTCFYTRDIWWPHLINYPIQPSKNERRIEKLKWINDISNEDSQKFVF